MITVMVIMMMTMSMPWFVSFKTDTFGCSLHSLSFYILRLTKECQDILKIWSIEFTFSLWAACTFFLAAAMSGTGSVNSMVSSSLGLFQVDTPVSEL